MCVIQKTPCGIRLAIFDILRRIIGTGGSKMPFLELLRLTVSVFLEMVTQNFNFFILAIQALIKSD